MTELISKDFEKKLAEVSEESNFAEKNRYRLDKTKLSYADKKRMPVDQDKIKEILRNRADIRMKIEDEIENYSGY